MKAYWDNLNERERWVLGLGIIFCIVYLFYLVVYAPLSHAVQQKSQQFVEKQQTLAWMQRVRGQRPTNKAAETLTSSQLLTVLAEQLNKTSFKTYPFQLQQTGASDIQLSFDQVPYTAFLIWLSSINEKYMISIKQLNIERSDTPGVVKLMLVIATK